MNFKCFLEQRSSISSITERWNFDSPIPNNSLFPFPSPPKKKFNFPKVRKMRRDNECATRDDRRVWREISRSIKKIEEVFEGNSCVRGTLSANFNGRRGYRGAMTTERRLAVMACARACICVYAMCVCVATTYVSTPFHDRARPLSPVCGHVQISR